jgi:hypothetical protein
MARDVSAWTPAANAMTSSDCIDDLDVMYRLNAF